MNKNKKLEIVSEIENTVEFLLAEEIQKIKVEVDYLDSTELLYLADSIEEILGMTNNFNLALEEDLTVLFETHPVLQEVKDEDIIILLDKLETVREYIDFREALDNLLYSEILDLAQDYDRVLEEVTDAVDEIRDLLYLVQDIMEELNEES